jgi:hypothetical protein
VDECASSKRSVITAGREGNLAPPVPGERNSRPQLKVLVVAESRSPDGSMLWLNGEIGAGMELTARVTSALWERRDRGAAH